jgi:hypothetical protein
MYFSPLGVIVAAGSERSFDRFRPKRGMTASY